MSEPREILARFVDEARKPQQVRPEGQPIDVALGYADAQLAALAEHGYKLVRVTEYDWGYEVEALAPFVAFDSRTHVVVKKDRTMGGSDDPTLGTSGEGKPWNARLDSRDTPVVDHRPSTIGHPKPIGGVRWSEQPRREDGS